MSLLFPNTMSNITTPRSFMLLSFIAILFVPSAARTQPVLQPRVAFPKLRFVEPVGLVQPGDGSNRLFVIEKAGIIRVFDNTDSVDTARVFLDIRDRVTSEGGEQGLLGLAFPPNFADIGYFYVYYSASDPFRTILARYTLDENNPQVADPNSEFILFTVNRWTNFHNAGQLAFGPDGYLYIALGEGGQEYAAPVPNSFLGKILRIDVEPGSNGELYSIPPDNPLVGNTENFKEEVYAWGFRNPWRFSIDPVTGMIWAADVGPENWEEVNIIEPGNNYGWPRMEGNHCYPPQDTGCDRTGLTPPIWEYGHDSGVAVVGGYVYRGSRLPDLVGEYICGDFGVGRIWGIRYDGTGPATSRVLVESGPTITSFGVDAHNELYFCSFNGQIYTLDTLEPKLGVDSPSDHAISLVAVVNHPNPFSTTTSIHYSLNHAGHVRLVVRDVLGGIVATPVDEVQSGGEHDVAFDGTSLSPGTYYYTILDGDGNTGHGRMVLVK